MTELDDFPIRDDSAAEQSWQINTLPPVQDHDTAQQLMEVQDDPEALNALAIQLGVIEE